MDGRFQCSTVLSCQRLVNLYPNLLPPPSSAPAKYTSKLGLMTAVHTPWSALLQAGLTVLGFCYHRNALHTAGVTGFHPLVVGPGVVGLVEPCVSLCPWICSRGDLNRTALCRYAAVSEIEDLLCHRSCSRTRCDMRRTEYLEGKTMKWIFSCCVEIMRILITLVFTAVVLCASQVRFAVWLSEVLHKIEFFTITSRL